MIIWLGSHDFQVANWVLGATPESVVGHGSINFFDDGREVYDNFALVFKYPNGIHFSYDCITSNKMHGMQVQVPGNEGNIELETNQWVEECHEDQQVITHVLEQLRHVENDTI